MKESNQHCPDQEKTVTPKSSGMNYERTSLTPSQSDAQAREKSTQNDKG